MGVILQFAYLFVYMYTLLVIYKPSGTFAAKVYISQNLTGLIGNNDIQLTCLLINEKFEKTSNVQFLIKNQTDDVDLWKPIAILEPDRSPEFLPSGNYLNGRVMLTNITSASTNATLTFYVLKCEDEKDYMCQFNYKLSGGVYVLESSPSTRISVRASSSKPNLISSIVVVSTTTEMQGFSTSTYNNSLSTTKGDTSHIDTVITSQSSEKLPLVFREGDTVLFTCTGNIGNPPGKLIWQKTFPQDKKPITYSNATTCIEEITGQCSFKGTSHLTVKVYAEDIKATIRCFEESQVNVRGMYLETEPFDIQFHVDELPSSKDSSLLKMVIVYVIPVVCAVLFIVICVAVIKHWCIRPKKKENKENYYQTLSHDGITVNAEYATVIHTHNKSAGEAADNLVCSNDKERNERTAETKKGRRFGSIKTFNPAANVCTCPNDELCPGYLTCVEATGSTSIQYPDNYEELVCTDPAVVYNEINQQTTLNYEVSEARIPVPTGNAHHTEVAIQSSVNDG